MAPKYTAYNVCRVQRTRPTECVDNEQQCSASTGSDEPSYGYPVTDLTSCACSEWNPISENFCIWQAVPQHHPVRYCPWSLAFFGLSFSQNYHTAESIRANFDVPPWTCWSPASVSHQSSIDLNRLQDRAGEFVRRSDDSSWLCGGGQGIYSGCLTEMDSAHVELMHLFAVRDGWRSQSDPTVKSNFEKRVEDQGYTKAQAAGHVAGWDFEGIIKRITSELQFDRVRIVPTDITFTDKNEAQLRINPPGNATETTLYDNLINLFIDCQVLGSGDPFHISLARDLAFCSRNDREEYRNQLLEYTLSHWKEKAESENGIIINADIDRYSRGEHGDISGGFYLFYTRRRPLVYFSPSQSPGGVQAYFCRWEQTVANAIHSQGNEGDVLFADPNGGVVKETLLLITDDVSAESFRIYRQVKDGGFDFSFLPRSPPT